VGIFAFDPVDLIAGSLPKRQRRLLEAWAELHQAELARNWQNLQAGRKPTVIEPLK
jgi:Domain of unknown function (DUF4160)